MGSRRLILLGGRVKYSGERAEFQNRCELRRRRPSSFSKFDRIDRNPHLSVPNPTTHPSIIIKSAQMEGTCDKVTFLSSPIRTTRPLSPPLPFSPLPAFDARLPLADKRKRTTTATAAAADGALSCRCAVSSSSSASPFYYRKYT